MTRIHHEKIPKPIACSGGLLLAMVFLASVRITVSAGDCVNLWDRFEVALENDRSYADPYGEVSLDVTYTRPDGSEVEFWGFHDGGSTWKIRMMPDSTGTWQYRARFSDGAPGSCGSFECVPSDLPGMFTSDEVNPMWFGFRGGRHLLVRSLHVGDRFFASNWASGKRRAFLDWAERQGYNMLSVASHYLNRDAAGRGRGWKTPDLWPLDAAEFRKLEAILDRLVERRILVYPFGGFFSKGSDFPRSSADQTLYMRYVFARLGPYWNILLNVAGPEPNLNRQTYLDSRDVTRLGEEIRRLDVFGHPLSVHNRTGDDPYRDSDWSTYSTLQGPKVTDLRKLSQVLLRNHHARKPLYAQETLWPGNKYHKALQTGDDVRKNAYVILLSGAAINFGDMDGNSSSGFSGSMDPELCVQARHDLIHRVWDVLESVSWYRMRPHQDLVNRGFCLAEPGRQYLVYLDVGGSVNVRVKGGPYVIQWISARNPLDRRTGGRTSDGKNLAAPSVGEDWLLRLRRPTRVFSVKADNTGTELDGRPFLPVGLRVSNALLSDATTRDLIDHLDELTSFGVNTISVFFQGSRFGDVRGYREDGSLDPVYAIRMGRIIEAADERGMVVLVGCLYHGNSRGKWESWDQEDAERAIAGTVRWLMENDYRNVLLDVNNEHMAEFDDARLIEAGKAIDPRYVMGTSGRETPTGADLSLHHGRPDIPGKYYIQSEGTLPGGYWGSYSKRDGLYNYIHIGIYPEDMKQKMRDYTDRYLNRGQGFLFASTWLQSVPPHGPNHCPGGYGTADDPGVRWWLEHLRDRVGPYDPADR